MPLVYNTLEKDFQGKALGNYHTIPAGKWKMFGDNLAHWLATNRAEEGLVALSEKFEDPQYALTEEGKLELAEAKRKGHEARVRFLNRQVFNEQISLKMDLERSNIKHDPNLLASDEVLAMYKELASYRKKADDATEQRAKQIADLQKTLKSGG